MKCGNKKGFTLIELLVVIAIIAILAAILIPAVTSGLLNAKMLKMVNNGKQIYTSAFAADSDDQYGSAVTFPRSAGRLSFVDTHDYFIGLVTNKVLEVDYSFFSGPGVDILKSTDESKFTGDFNAWKVCVDIGAAPDGSPFLVSRNLDRTDVPAVTGSGSGTDLYQDGNGDIGEADTAPVKLDFNKDALIVVQKGGAAFKIKARDCRNSANINATTVTFTLLKP